MSFTFNIPHGVNIAQWILSAPQIKLCCPAYRLPGMSITVWYFCGNVDCPPPTSKNFCSWLILPGKPEGWTPPLFDESSRVDGAFGFLPMLRVFAFASARLCASSKVSNFVGVEMAKDFGLNFFGDPKLGEWQIKCYVSEKMAHGYSYSMGYFNLRIINTYLSCFDLLTHCCMKASYHWRLARNSEWGIL